MRAEQADVVIIGAGLAGSATACALAGRGRSVVLLEAFQPGHWRGSSHGSARIFRRAYPDPLYVRLTGQAQVLWRQLADEAGEEFVAPAGAVDFGPSRLQGWFLTRDQRPRQGHEHRRQVTSVVREPAHVAE